ncbi:uncharacterized protein LOC129572788 [Sitodiplosis mosellana]|uniref:uncharacterized protein LOC129572788 n=1 Tax=Sitodiplosis mosellana TaxID=263140 RepID=UPI002445168D|nr:uncharacterized protein LOC129572788 [Sitodiplosis mosellana]
MLKKNGIDMKCYSNVVGNVVSESALKGAWAETKTKFGYMMVEWNKCMKMDDSQQYECMMGVFGMGGKILGRFVQNLGEKPNWPLMMEINAKCIAECFNGEEGKQMFSQKMKCMVEATTEAVKGSAFAQFWEEYVQLLAYLGKQLKVCGQKPSDDEISACIVKEFPLLKEMNIKLYEQMKMSNKEGFMRVAKYVKGKCFQ